MVSPLQVAQMTQALANEATLCPPRLIKQEVTNCREIGIQEQNLRLVVQGMLQACSARGTAYPFFARNASLAENEEGVELADLDRGAIACKTGTAEFGGTDDRGYRKTHAWFTAFVSMNELQQLVKERAEQGFADPLQSQNQPDEASPSAELAEESDEDQQDKEAESDGNKIDHDLWLSKVHEHGFPNQIVITVLVESDEGTPFREGSDDAAPVAKEILDWMEGRS